MRKITVLMLDTAGACWEGREEFEALFPEGVVPTLELCRKHAMDLDFAWAGNALLDTGDNTAGWDKFCEGRNAAYEAFDDAGVKLGEVYWPVTEKFARNTSEVVEAYGVWQAGITAAREAQYMAIAVAFFEAWSLEPDSQSE